MGKMRFRVNAGKYVGKAPDGKGSKVYRQGETVETDIDLTKYNSASGTQKFERLDQPRLRRGETDEPHVPDREEVLSTVNVAAPGGQVSSGFQVASQSTEGGVGGISNPAAQTIGEKQRAELEAKAAAKNQPASKPSAKPAEKSHYTEEELDTFTVPELKALAEEEEIDLKGATLKADIVKAFGAKKAK